MEGIGRDDQYTPPCDLDSSRCHELCTENHRDTLLQGSRHIQLRIDVTFPNEKSGDKVYTYN